MREKRTAIVFGCQNCPPIANDSDLVHICRQPGIRFIQLSCNNQSLLATGCTMIAEKGELMGMDHAGFGRDRDGLPG